MQCSTSSNPLCSFLLQLRTVFRVRVDSGYMRSASGVWYTPEAIMKKFIYMFNHINKLCHLLLRCNKYTKRM